MSVQPETLKINSQWSRDLSEGNLNKIKNPSQNQIGHAILMESCASVEGFSLKHDVLGISETHCEGLLDPFNIFKEFPVNQCNASLWDKKNMDLLRYKLFADVFLFTCSGISFML